MDEKVIKGGEKLSFNEKGQTTGIQYALIILVIISLIGSWMAVYYAGQTSVPEDLATKSDIESLSSSMSSKINSLSNTLSSLSDSVSNIEEKIGAVSGARFSTSVNSPTVGVGETAEIKATVTNTGNESGTESFTLTVGGEEVSSEEVTLNPGETKAFTFEVEKDQSGSYDIEFDGSVGTLTIQPPIEPHVLKMGYSRSVHNAPFRMAKNYLPETMTVEWVDLGEYGMGRAAALAQGMIVGYSSSIPYFITMLEDDVPVYLLMQTAEGGQAVLAREDSDIQSVEDLEGKTVSAGLFTGTHLFGLSALIEKGIENPMEAINWKDFKSPEAAVIALKEGKVDATIVWEPWASRAIAEGWGRRVPGIYDGAWGRASQGLFMYGPYIEEHPQAVQAWVNTEYEAQQYLIANSKGKGEGDVWLQETMEVSGMDEPTASAALQNAWVDPEAGPSGGPPQVPKLEEWYAMRDLMYEVGMITENVSNETIRSHIDLSYLSNATGKPEDELYY
ncbi:hypothetical protein AKJ62_02965 [candidate division MSBL1 archaeon SCGC-AAA259D14]|uniref:CARDB domain-containing protein n=1 Tax=candidate division MSBL1 archaeon SCGC-AAA259D14 TaxID=1698261 RepID=A0A133U5R8_9EURY|nr:hypothetical protein AKJ62_02965 [candidate division MSBL1 archaeon SCGC-AAA259D14]